ncbi:type II toxin-antitoxin system HicA family toxin [Leucobacter sp. HY1908]
MIDSMPPFPSMKAGVLERLLMRELGYYVDSQRGSHKKMKSKKGYPPLLFAFHDGQEIAPGLVRKILMKDIGLDLSSVEALLGMR